MTGFLEGISNFFARHRAHCRVHEVYQSDCAACVEANRTVYVDTETVEILDTAGDSFVPTESAGVDSFGGDSSSGDSSNTDSPSCDTSDFGGFDGGDSGGGGASGDF